MENLQERLYATHLEALQWVFNQFSPEAVLEFGMGDHSTNYFLANNCSLLSVEEQSEEWYSKMTVKISSGKWQPVLCLHPKEFSYPENSFDLVFIDGHQLTRSKHLNYYLGKAKIVVAHDWEKRAFYNWKSVSVPENYSVKIFEDVGKTTAVFVQA